MIPIAGPTQDDSDTFTHELRGIIPRGFEYLFSLINREKGKVRKGIALSLSLSICLFLSLTHVVRPTHDGTCIVGGMPSVYTYWADDAQAHVVQ